ncbi:SSS family solute:Na+ symporter [Caldalkalibacillus uzonensis]|uniref:SSS family solute:Na+ symporter n=1 Tax=Caldalkalibacillus uzonensis TaxID=353224 RepID=A0ABU0CRI8_9BACI|nr:sodium:solute symporter family protein [Caldalkalibacillus uzonensis]MDQ0338688.1 SSS family solute:Na+ symporter [Caldalkalibacillus uzonensis]
MLDWQIAMVMMIAYLGVALLIGILAGRGRGKLSLDEFTVAGRNLGLFVTWFLMGGAIFSAFTFLGAPGWAYSRGAPAFYITAYTAFAILPWYVIGPKIGRIGRKRGLYSLVGFLQGRYPIKSLAILVGLIVFFASIQYLATQLKGMAIIFNIMTEGRIPLWLGALMAYAIVVIYVATGGLRAAAWSDVFQGMLMLVISWAVGLAIVFQIHGSIAEMFQNIAQANPGFLEIGNEGSTMSKMAYTTLILVSAIGFLMWPHLFSRSYSSNALTIKRTVIAYPLFALFVVPLLLVGFAGISLVDPGQLNEPDTILPYLITTVLQMPGWLYGLVGAGALAAAMSTADVITHSASLEFTDGVIKNIWTKLSEKTVLIVMRTAVVVIGALAYLVAVFGGQGLIALLAGAYGSIVQFAPAVYSAMYWKRATPTGVVAGMAAGFVVNFYYQIINPVTPLDIHAGILGLIVNVAVLITVSYLTKPQSADLVNEYVDAEKEVYTDGGKVVKI